MMDGAQVVALGRLKTKDEVPHLHRGSSESLF
jgi:hypothetical protein